jgi:hypothetical protein
MAWGLSAIGNGIACSLALPWRMDRGMMMMTMTMMMNFLPFPCRGTNKGYFIRRPLRGGKKPILFINSKRKKGIFQDFFWRNLTEKKLFLPLVIDRMIENKDSSCRKKEKKQGESTDRKKAGSWGKRKETF